MLLVVLHLLNYYYQVFATQSGFSGRGLFQNRPYQQAGFPICCIRELKLTVTITKCTYQAHITRLNVG